MDEAGKRADVRRLIGDLVEVAEPIFGQGGEVVEYVIPAHRYEELVTVWAALQQREII